MRKTTISLYLFIGFCLAGSLLLIGCEETARSEDKTLEKPRSLDINIGLLAEFYDFGAIPVRGFAIVANLNGTGSSECPPDLRDVLVKYISQQTLGKSSVNPNDFINSKDTAIVEVYGVIPPISYSGQRFDVKVTALPDTQTTSLDGGRLFTAELKPLARITRFNQYAKTLAVAAGPIFVNKIDGSEDDEVSGYVLAGGMTLNEAKIIMAVKEPNYFVASTIRNRINERFGPNTAKALSPEELVIRIPEEYKEHREKFLSMVNLLYIANNSQSQAERIDSLVQELATSQDKVTVELSLDAIGKPVLKSLAVLLQSNDEKTRFHAARCMLDIGNSKALGVLRDFANDKSSIYRLDAVNAIGVSAKRNESIPFLNQLLSDKDFQIRYVAYDHLRKFGDISVSRSLIAGDFFVDSVISSGENLIFVTRADIPKIVIFGSPIRCSQDMFIESRNGNIIINAKPGEKYASVMRKHAKEPKLIGPVMANLEVTDIIKALSETPPKSKDERKRPGLAVPYADTIAILDELAKSGYINAEFKTGPMTLAGAILEKNDVKDR
ncbi:MAG: flagellar basal body P-ring protein FlgI [Sedimentisphaerales bacterium]|nr:flagellar basal body P-ring protein FlgI [Sedimentisphaerales bacterium]